MMKLCDKAFKLLFVLGLVFCAISQISVIQCDNIANLNDDSSLLIKIENKQSTSTTKGKLNSKFNDMLMNMEVNKKNDTNSSNNAVSEFPSTDSNFNKETENSTKKPAKASSDQSSENCNKSLDELILLVQKNLKINYNITNKHHSFTLSALNKDEEQLKKLCPLKIKTTIVSPEKLDFNNCADASANYSIEVLLTTHGVNESKFNVNIPKSSVTCQSEVLNNENSCQVRNFNHVLQENNRANLSWDVDLMINNDCDNIQISITITPNLNGPPIIIINYITQLQVQTEVLIACMNYEVAWSVPGATQIKSQLKTNPKEIGKVQRISYSQIGNTVKASWQPPTENFYCKVKYELTRDDTIGIYTADTESFDFPNQEPCNVFIITIYAVSEANTSGRKENHVVTVNESKPSSIINLNYNPTSNFLNWEAPEEAPKCVEKYSVTTSSLDSITIESLNIVLGSLYACSDYNVTVVPITKSNIRGEPYTKEIRTESKAPDTPSGLIKISSSSTSLSFLMIYNTTNNCRIDYLELLCKSSNLEDTTKQFPVASWSDMEMNKLKIFTKYNCSARIKNIHSTSNYGNELSLTTDQDKPSVPRNLILFDATSTNFSIQWELPESINGVISKYIIYIRLDSSLRDDCSDVIEKNDTTIENASTELLRVFEALPFSTYIVQVAAETLAGRGEFTSSTKIKTLPGKPDIVKNASLSKISQSADQNYQVEVQLEFTLPCRPNGIIKNFSGTFEGKRRGFADHSIPWKTDDIDKNSQKVRIETNSMKPEYNYSTTIEVLVEDSDERSDPVYVEFASPAGIPPFENQSDWGVMSFDHVKDPTKSFKITFSSNIFSQTMGEIKKYALLIQQLDCGDPPNRKSNLIEREDKLNNWKDYSDDRCIEQYVTAEIYLNETESKDSSQQKFDFTIGNQSCNGSVNEICNGFLRPSTNYAVTVRGYTSHGFSDSTYIQYKTEKPLAFLLIFAAIVSILFSAFFIGLAISWRNNKKAKKKALNSISMNPNEEPIDISVRAFPVHYEMMISNENDKIVMEYSRINEFSNNLNKTNIASKTNEKLNRYVNIFPYDSNRVVLDTDEYENDYINASYIDGYKYDMEYIAAQGPKPDTCIDFWRMILLHKVESIVMLTSLVEGDKIKCHEYYPKLNGVIRFDCISISCTQELNFTLYVKRILIIKKDDVDHTVSHYYFTKWPDHDVPQHPSELIRFVRIIRNERKNVSIPCVVHCSAGVGRTGTFIGLDIIIQRIKEEKKINIYDVVKQMRYKRLKMVQTIKQYIFLYQCTYELLNSKPSQNLFARVSQFIEDLTASNQDSEKIRKALSRTALDEGIEPSKIKKEGSVIIQSAESSL